MRSGNGFGGNKNETEVPVGRGVIFVFLLGASTILGNRKKLIKEVPLTDVTPCYSELSMFLYLA